MPRLLSDEEIGLTSRAVLSDADVGLSDSATTATRTAEDAQPKLGSAVGVPGLEHAALPDASPAAPAAAVAHNPMFGGTTLDRAKQGMEDSRRGTKLALQTVGQGAADVLGTPVDIVTMLKNAGYAAAEAGMNFFREPGNEVKPLRIENPALGSEWIQDKAGDAAQALGYEPVKPETTGEEFANEIGRFGTSAFIPAVGAVRAAPAIAARGGPIAEAVKPLIDSPARVIATETAASMGAGGGVATAKEALPEESQGPITSMVSALLGGATAGAGASRAGKMVHDHTTTPEIPAAGRYPAPGRRAIEDARADMQGAAIDPEAAATSLREGRDFYADADMTAPSAGVLSNDEGLIALENTMRRHSPAPFVRNDRQVRADASAQVQSVAPEADPRLATDYAARDADVRTRRAQQRVDRAEGRAEQGAQSEADALTGYRSRAELTDDASKRLDRSIVDDTLRPMRDEKNRRFAEIDPEGTVQRPVAPLADTVRSIRDAVPETVPANEVLPERWLQQIERLEEGGTIPYRDIEAMRPHLSTAIKSARTRGDYAMADNLQQLRRAVDQEAERLAAEGGQAGDAGRRAQEASQFYREDYAPRFVEGEGGRFRRDIDADDTARSATPPTATAKRFLQAGAGGEEVAANLRQILDRSKSREEGMTAARDYLIADMSRVIDAAGKANAKAIRSYIEKRQGVFRAFPEFKAEAETLLRDVVNRREQSNTLLQKLKDTQRDLKMTETDINKGTLSLLLDRDPRHAVAAVFSSGDPERQMAAIVERFKGNEGVTKAWKRAVADHLYEKVTTTARQSTADSSRPVSLAAAERTFKTHEKALAKVFTPEEMMAVRRARRVSEEMARTGLAASAKTTTAEDFAGLMRWSEIALKLKFGGLRGGNYTRALRLGLKAVPGVGRGARSLELIERAMFDPALAAHLLDPPTNAQAFRKWAAQAYKLAGISEAARDLNDEDEEN